MNTERAALLKSTKEDLDRTYEHIARSEQSLRLLYLVVTEHLSMFGGSAHMGMDEIRDISLKTPDGFFRNLALMYIGEVELLNAVRSNTKRMKHLFLNLVGSATQGTTTIPEEDNHDTEA